jgi:hypothetical protein
MIDVGLVDFTRLEAIGCMGERSVADFCGVFSDFR